MKKIMLVIISLMLCMSAYGKGGDGNELLEYCTEFEKAVEGDTDSGFTGGVCIGTVRGVMDTMDHMSPNKTGIEACIPDGVTTGQATRVVIKYLRDNPSLLHQNGVSLAMSAFMQAYPCK